MAKALINMIRPGIQLDGSPFSAIHGTYTIDSDKNYVFGIYKIPVYNVSSLAVGDLPEKYRIQNLLILD